MIIPALARWDLPTISVALEKQSEKMLYNFVLNMEGMPEEMAG